MFGSLSSFEGPLWDDFRRMERAMNDLFGAGLGRADIRAVASGSFPAVNVGNTPDAVYVYAFAPGVDPSTLDVSIERNLLSIAGERRAPERDGDERSGFHLNERFEGAFRRVVALSDDADPGQVSAAYRNGVLTVRVGKREAARPRQIQVNSD